MANHSVVHVEISADNPQAAGKFYADLFGWPVETDSQYNYTMFKTPAGLDGGFAQTNHPHSPTVAGDVVMYISTDNIDESLARAQELGAKIHQAKYHIPGVGHLAIITDPTGNKIGLLQGEMA